MVQQGPPPPRSSRTPGRRVGQPWQDEDYGDDEEYPPWAAPGTASRPAGHGRRERGKPAGDGWPGTSRDVRRPAPPSARTSRAGSRTAAGRSRRARRLIWGGALAVVVVIAVAVVAGLALARHPAPRPRTAGLVTTFQPGEFRSVPSTCSSVSAATLAQYLPGRRRIVRPHSLFGAAQSLCDWSQAARWLNATAQAYAPSGLAPGNGSATEAAIGAYQQARANLSRPPRKTHLPKATLTAVSGLGQSAFASLQVAHTAGATTDILTVLARQRNVLVTVVFEATSNGRAGSVPTAELRSGAIAAARDILARLR